MGTSTQVKFPTGVGAEKNDGVAAAISQTDGAIGYVGLAYALSNELNMPLVENSAGELPRTGREERRSRRRRGHKIGPKNEISLAELPASAKGAYPISTYTYVIVPLEIRKGGSAEEVHHLRDRSGPEIRPRTRLRAAARRRSSPPTRRRSQRSAARWRPEPSATPFCGPGATSQTASATRCCEASPASQQRSPWSSIVGIVYEVIHLAWPAISKFGIGFVTTNDWNPVTERFGAAPFLYGTVVTSSSR